MNGLYDSRYPAEELQELDTARGLNGPDRSDCLSATCDNPASSYPMDQNGTINLSTQDIAGDSLDTIVRQNDKEILRRQSLSEQFTDNNSGYRSSVTEFGMGNGEIDGFQYMITNELMESKPRKNSSAALELVGYEDLQQNINMYISQNEISRDVHGSNLLVEPNQILQNMSVSGEPYENMINTPMGVEVLMEEENYGMNLYSPQYSLNLEKTSIGPIKSGFVMTSPDKKILPPHCELSRNGNTSDIARFNAPRTIVSSKTTISSSINENVVPSLTTDSTSQFMYQNSSYSMGPVPPLIDSNNSRVKQADFQFQNVYCQSGFDLLGALMKVASRKSPEINIGKVDMSCAFTVCDALKYDCPIIYVSEVFERLTGYNQYEVKGQNCRFLQSPDGKVEAGARREFVDNDSVRYLKERILENKEAQRSVINYRKGGQPFMNILTVIPITGEDDTAIRYYVGFQVDLVEMPASVQGKTASGTFNVNYSQSTIPRYIWQSSAATSRQVLGTGQSISREDVTTVLASIYAGNESELMKRMWDKILIENTDDVIHVLSLKGVFLYLSPSSRRVLEYDASELVGTSLSAVCHPSDIVSVTRELKDTSTGVPVNMIFRIRRKKSGYTWFESHGSLCIEQGKGRKCIILVGRERPVYALDRFDVESAGGIGENEMWNKISTSGMFLFVSSSARTLLDRSPSDLIGTSIQAFMRTDSKMEFCQSLDKARTGRIITQKHEILGKRGLMMQAQTTLFPGDSSEGQKPTFLVAQTRLLKSPLKTSANDNTHIFKNSAVPDSQKPHDNNSLGIITRAGSSGLAVGSQDVALASDANIFDELKTTRCTSWQFELRQMEKSNRLLAEELATLLSNKKKRKRRKITGYLHRDCANCHTRVTPEWRRGPSGHRDLCNSCGLRYAKQNGRVSPRNLNRDKLSTKSWTSLQSSPLQQVLGHSSVKSLLRNNSSNMSSVSSESSEFSKKIIQPDSCSEMTRSSEITWSSDLTPLTGQTVSMATSHAKSTNENSLADEISHSLKGGED